MTEAARRIAELQNTVIDALRAMDECRYGDARRILTKGKADALKPLTGVLARDVGQ